MKFVFFILLSLFLLVSCGDNKSEKTPKSLSSKQENFQGENLVKLSKEYNGVLQRQHIAVTPSGDLAFLMLKDNNLVFKSSNHETVIKKTPAKRYWLKISGDFVYAFWWVKYNTHEEKNIEKAGKALYVNVSNDKGKTFSKAIKLNDHLGVLPDLHVQATADGKISVAYLDERYGGHQIFSNASSDGGKTWLEHDIEINQVSSDADEINKGKDRITAAVTPNLLLLGNRLVVIWEQVESFKGKSAVSFMSRTSLDFGKTWADSELIHRDFKRISVELYSTSTANDAYLFAVLEEGLALFIKNKDKKWQRMKGYVPGTENSKTKVVSYFKTVFDQDFLYVTYINVEGNLKTDNHTEFQVFDIKSKTWSRKHRFDTLKDSAREYSRSYFQDIGILKDGTLIVAWEDYRGILPSIFMSYSVDHGNSWASPIPLTKVGLESANVPFLITSKNKYFLFYKYVVLAHAIQPFVHSKQLMLPSPKSKEFTKIKFPQITLPEKKESLKLLKSRVNKLMTIRKKKKIDKMLEEWDYLDPIYKSFTTQTKWLDQRNMFDYIDYKVENIAIKGTTALVKLSMSYRLNKKFVNNETSPGEVKKTVVEMMWGWFYDNWYLIPDNPKQSYLP